MADTNLSSISGALKRVYDDYVQRQQNLSHRSIDEIAKSLTKYNPGGEGFFGSIDDYGNESVGAISEEESFRTIDSEHYAQWKVVPKVMVAPIQFSGLVSKAADSDEEAFVNIVIDALDTAKERLLKDENRQFFGLGNGRLASPAGAVLSNATSFSVDSAQYLRANMVIDVYNGASLITAAARISDVDKTSNVVYLNASLAFSIATTHDLVKQNIRVSPASDGKEAMGLRGIVDDSTDLTTFQNIDATLSRIWRGRRIDASSANLTSDLLQRLLDDVRVLSDEECDTIIMHPKQRRKYLDLVVPQKRYMDGDMDTGFSKLQFNGIDLFLDPDCQDDTVYALKKSLIRKFEVEAMGMGTHDGSDKFLRLSNQDVFQAYWRHYMNFGSPRRNAHGKLVSLAKPTGVS
jgi:hypothetical protein